MPTLTFARRAAAAAFVVCVLTAAPAGAFSQIGTRDGAAPQREGIVSVPLPPLPGTDRPAESGPPATRPDPAPAAPVPGGTPAAASAPQEPAAQEPAAKEPAEGPAPAKTVSPPDSATPQEGTDDGEVEDPAIDLGPPGTDGTEAPAGDADAPPGTQAPLDDTPALPVVYGDEGLPKPVRDLRERLIAIGKSGDIEALRPYIATGDDGTVLSFGEPEGDPIAFLKAASGDGEGVEVLAILLEVLQSGHVRQEPDSDNEIFVWPYFTAVAIDRLTKPQKVELFELVTAGDYQEMLGFGAYNFYRIGISPDGKLQFFVAGD